MFVISNYDVRGLPTNCNGLHLRPDIMSLFAKSDIVCVHETWYAYQDLDIFHNLHSEYRRTGILRIIIMSADCLTISGR